VFGSFHLTHQTSDQPHRKSNIHSFVIPQHEQATPKEVRFYLLEDHKNWRVPERRVAKFVKRFRRAPGSAADDDDMSTMSAISVASSVVSQKAKSVVKGVGNILHLRSRSKNKLEKESTRDHPPVVSLLGAISLHDDGVSEVHEDDPLDSLLFASPAAPPNSFASPFISSPVLPPKENIKETQPDDSEAATEFVTALESVVEEAEVEAEVKGRSLVFADGNDGLVFEDDNDGKKQGGLCEPCEGCNIL
jgi:hypothetical protein